MAILIASFTFFELIPSLRNLEFDKKYLPLGGAVSGFFGGLSGHQGALRSAFLARTGLSKEQFIGTGTAIACFIDVARIGIYSKNFATHTLIQNAPLFFITTLAAFLGAYIGSKILKKITMKKIL
jgi:uncharacterized membrane protein YfcA